MKINFETAIEKLGRILARQYNINVVYEGDKAETDGKTITLPFVKSMTEELYQDLNGYLDHEVAHCKFTEFPEMKLVKTKFHEALFQIAEDNRVEREMVKEYPGCELNLSPLNAKLKGELHKKWDDLPWPVRTVIGIGDMMNGQVPRIDEDTERYIDLVKDAAKDLRKCKDTKQIRELTQAIVKMIIEEREEEKKEEKKSGGGEGEGKGEADKMLHDGSGKPSEWDEHVTDVTSMINDELKDHIDDEKKNKIKKEDLIEEVWNDQPSIPTTTRFDLVTDYSGKGDRSRYSEHKRKVMPMVSSIKGQLERILKVQENAKWTSERERGSIDAKTLAKMASDKNYRTVFREFTKIDTSNVAVEILIDQSGSMSGSKIQNAKMAAIAMTEALKDLGIACEVTGFYSEGCAKMAAYAKEIGVEGSRYGGTGKRFNRTYERLNLQIFKSFDSASLTGLEKVSAHSNNPDGECVAWAAKRLAARPEARKILMVLSDGMPAADGDTAILNSDLKNKVNRILKSGIECIGIGIETDIVKRFYRDYVVLGSSADLPRSTMKKLSALITRGAKLR